PLHHLERGLAVGGGRFTECVGVVFIAGPGPDPADQRIADGKIRQPFRTAARKERYRVCQPVLSHPTGARPTPGKCPITHNIQRRRKRATKNPSSVPPFSPGTVRPGWVRTTPSLVTAAAHPSSSVASMGNRSRPCDSAQTACCSPSCGSSEQTQ